jgi:hypothetical protein
MRTYRAVTVARPSLPKALFPLWSPVVADEPSAPGEYVGHTEGAILDEEGRVVAFLVRLAPKIARSRPRSLVAASAIRITDESVLQLSWSEDQLRAQPHIDEALQPHSAIDGRPPVESRWMPARPAVIPPGRSFNRREAVKEGLEGGLAGVIAGSVVGLAIGGPLVAVSLAAFCAAGGSIAGVLSGASQESAAEAGEMKFEAPPDAKHTAALERLEYRLSHPMLGDAHLLEWTTFAPITTPLPRRSESNAANHR